MSDSTTKKKPSKKNKPKNKSSQLDGDIAGIPIFGGVLSRGESPLLKQSAMNGQEEDNYRRMLDDIDSAGYLKASKITEEKKQMKKKNEESMKEANNNSNSNAEKGKVEDKKKKERKLSKKIDEKDKPQGKRKTEEKIAYCNVENNNIKQESRQQTYDGQVYYFQQRQQQQQQQFSCLPECIPQQHQQIYKQDIDNIDFQDIQLDRQLQFELHQKKLEQQARKLESSIRRAEEESRRLREDDRRRKEEEKISLEIIKISEEMKDWQFELMSEKSVLSITNGLSSITKQLGSTAKLKDLKADKLLREREKQYQLLCSMQKVTEQFLAAVMMSNKKLDVTQCAVTPYIKWIYKTLGKKERHSKKIDQENVAEQQQFNHRNNYNNNNGSAGGQISNDENHSKQENQQWVVLLNGISQQAGE